MTITKILRISSRSFSPAIRYQRFYHELSFTKTGEPEKVIQHRTIEIGQNVDVPISETSQVRVEMIAAPWNPADMNTVQGRYSSPYVDNLKDESRCQSRYFPSCNVVGSEGVGRITELSLTATDGRRNPFQLRVGDWVVLGLPGLGTMRSSVWLPTNAVMPLRKGEDINDICIDESGGPYAISSLFQLGGTALRMLRDFAVLEDGDVILQNAGNSGLGMLLSQLAACSGKKVIVVSFVRRGQRTKEQFDTMVKYLHDNGKNDIVVAEDDVIGNKDAMLALQEDIRKLSNRPPKLAINAVGGESASLLLNLVGTGGTLVTYGGMSLKPVEIGASQLIFKDVRIRGYWHSRWNVRNSECEPDKRVGMINEIFTLLSNGSIKVPPTKVFSFSQILEALKFEKTQSHAAIREKIVFDCIQN